MTLAQKGVDVRQTGTHIAFRASLKDSTGAKLTSGTTTLTLYELQSDGTLKSYDFNDNTFKTTALTTPTLSLTHRTGNNAGTNTGIWSAVLSTVSGFTVGGIYIVQVNNTGASPPDQEREFQYGGAEGDLAVTANGTGVAELNADVQFYGGSAGTFSGGRPEVNTTKWLGGTIPAVNVTGVPLVDAKYFLGTVFPTPTVAGVPNVNTKTINDVATTSVTTINANIGTTQPENFTGTGASALVKIDVVDWKGSTAPAMTGDAFALIGTAGAGLTALGDTRIAHLDADISSRGTSTLTQTQVTGGAYSVQSASCVLGDARIAHLDADISSRGTSTLTQAQVTGGAYALNSASFGFNSALDFTAAQKAATLARVTLVDTTTTNTDMRGTNDALLAVNYTAPDNAGISSAASSAATAALQTTAANIRAALGLATDNLDAQLAAIAAASGRQIIQQTTIVGTPTTTSVKMQVGSAIPNAYNDCLMVLEGSYGTMVQPVSSYVGGTTKTCSFDEAFPTTPAFGDAVYILASHVHPISQIQAGLATASQVGTSGNAPSIGEAVDVAIAEANAAHNIVADATSGNPAIRTAIDALPTTTDLDSVKLAPDGLDSISVTAPSGVPSNFRQMLVMVYRRFFKKSTLTSTQLKTYADNGTTVLTTQTASDDGTTQTLGDAS